MKASSGLSDFGARTSPNFVPLLVFLELTPPPCSLTPSSFVLRNDASETSVAAEVPKDESCDYQEASELMVPALNGQGSLRQWALLVRSCAS